MSERKIYLAVDLGAESGRVMKGTLSDEKLKLDEVHRFSNGPVERQGHLRWDFKKLFGDIKTGLKKAAQQTDAQICGIAVDSWGVDFGLIDEDGLLIDDPYHYRDSRTEGIMEQAFNLMGKKELYERTGIQMMQFNTVFQLMAQKKFAPDDLEKASKLLWMADLVSYHLCHRVYSEYTLVSTGQMMDMRTSQWSQDVFEKLNLPLDLMPEVVDAGNRVGLLTKEIASEIGTEQIPVIAAGSHDTASAVAAVPASGDNWAFLSSGTWSLLGVEIDKAVINEKTFEYQFTNEGGVKNTIRLLKNIMGLWLVQECKRQWETEGSGYSYDELTAMAQQAEAFKACLNPNDSVFLAPGNMVERINDFLTKTGQAALQDKGSIIRTVLESLAMSYKWVIESLEDVCGKKIEVLHIVGGGIQNKLLCQFAADATARMVVAGPIEATASGNIMMQAMAAGQVDSVKSARKIISNSFKPEVYKPTDTEKWEKQYEKFLKIFSI